MNLKTLLQHYCIYGIVHYLLNIYSSFDCYFWNWIWYVSGPILPGTPARTLSISGLESRVLKLSFLSLKMTVKSGL